MLIGAPGFSPGKIITEKNRLEILDHTQENCRMKNILLDHIDVNREQALKFPMAKAQLRSSSGTRLYQK
jgi:hypothetical protein